MVERCLRAKPKRRIASARSLRRGLETLLGTPSPADCQAELARWLWERGMFESRNDETVVLVADSPRPTRPGHLRPWAAALALSVSAACVALAFVRPQAVMRWTDDVVSLTRAAAEVPATRIAAAARDATVAFEDR
jgi:hypothetical protein